MPPRRSRLERSLDRLGAEMGERHRAQKADIDEMRVWLADRVLRGSTAPGRDALWDWVGEWTDLDTDPRARRDWCAMLISVLGFAGPELLHAGTPPLRRQSLVALRAMFVRRRDWRRQPADWPERSARTNGAVLAVIARHLFVKWDIPFFMDLVWADMAPRAKMKRDLYVHVAAGRSMRTANLPYRLTRRQAHEFLHGPPLPSIENALCRADAVSLGASPELAFELACTQLGAGMMIAPNQRDYWLSVIRYFVAHPEFAASHAGEVVDYLSARLHRDLRDAVRLHGRSPGRLLREVHDWHRELSARRLTPALARAPFPTPELKPLDIAAPGVGRQGDGERYRIRAIRNGAELQAEGAAMSHCVFSYLAACRGGACSIWSLESLVGETSARRATIRVQNRTVAEVKMRANRPPGQAERSVIDLWAKREGLQTRY